MKNWKLIAIIVTTAVVTAAAVAFIYQKLNRKHRIRFDSEDFDRDFDDDFDCGESYGRCDSVDEDIKIDDEEDELSTENFDSNETDTAADFEPNSLEEAAAMEEMLTNPDIDNDSPQTV